MRHAAAVAVMVLALAGCGAGQAVVQAGAPPPGRCEMYDDADAAATVPPS